MSTKGPGTSNPRWVNPGINFIDKRDNKMSPKHLPDCVAIGGIGTICYYECQCWCHGSNVEIDLALEHVDHPQHYGGDTTYEVIKVIEAWGLGFHLGNTVKYISRAGKKDKAKTLEDLKKAAWYLNREIGRMENETKDL